MRTCFFLKFVIEVDIDVVATVVVVVVVVVVFVLLNSSNAPFLVATSADYRVKRAAFHTQKLFLITTFTDW